MATSARRGQALVETAFGMFAFALVLAALCGFAEYIVKSLEIRRTLRAKAGAAALNASGSPGALVEAAGSSGVHVESLAAEFVFGESDVRVREKVALPPMGGTP